MATKKTKYDPKVELQRERSALEKFDLVAFKKWLLNYNFSLYQRFVKFGKELQMGIMCKAICDRTDMLNTSAYKKAVQWLKEHDMKGRLF